MSDALSRFRNRQKLFAEVSDKEPENMCAGSQEDISTAGTATNWSEYFDYNVDADLVELEAEAQRLREMSVSVSMEEANELLNYLRTQWTQDRQESLLGQCKKNCLAQIAAAFGMGKYIAAYDKNGGDVTTPHNARQGIYARDEDAFHRQDYTGKDFLKNSVKYRDSKISEDFLVQDEYTEKYLYYKDQNNRSSVDVDHINPVKKYHQEGGFIQSKEQRNAFGSDSENFSVTQSSINRSLKDSDKRTWMHKNCANDPEKTNKEFFEIKEAAIDEAIQRGKRATERHAPDNKDWAIYYTKRTAITGLKEAGKMGLQQAAGALFIEFFAGIFAELSDIFKNGLVKGVNAEGILDAIRKRFNRVLKRVASHWKDLVTALKDGAISGFFSKLLTTIINTVCSTPKIIIRLIREGSFSLLKAVKILILRPKGMSLAEAADAALKIIAAGISITVGIMLEDKIQAAISMVPFFTPIADGLAKALTGVVAALLSTMAVYFLDKVDLFGVNAAAKHKFVIEKLDRQIQEADMSIHRADEHIKAMDTEIDEIYIKAMYPFGKPMLQ